MKEFIQILHRFVPPYKKYLALSTLFNILSAVLNIFSFSLIVPILSILFQMEKATYTFMPWSSDASIKDIVINNFQYYITELINQYGPSTTLLLLGLFMAVHDLPEDRMLFPLFRYHDSHSYRHCPRYPGSAL